MFAVEFAELFRHGAKREGRPRSQRDGFVVQHRQSAGQAESNVADQRVGRRFAGIVTNGREQFGLGFELDMALECR